MVVDAELVPQLTVMGQVPAVVRAPTVQVQLTPPDALDVFGLKPWALDGPDL